MKSILYFLSCSCFLFLACNGNQATTSDKAANESTSSSSTTEAKTESSDASDLNTSFSDQKGEEESEKATTEAAINYSVLAEAYCACAKNTVSVNDRLAKLMKSGEKAAFDALLPEVEKAFKEAMSCCQKAKDSQSTAVVDQRKLFKPLKKVCPELPKQLMAKMVTEIK